MASKKNMPAKKQMKKIIKTFEERRREDVTKKNLPALSYIPFLYEEKIRYDKHMQSKNPPRCWSEYNLGSLEGELEYKVRVLKRHRLDYLRIWIDCLTQQHVMSYETFHPPPLAFWIAIKRELSKSQAQLLKTKGLVQAYREEVEAEEVLSSADQRVRDGLLSWLREMDTCLSKLTHKVEAHLQGTRYHLKYQTVYSGLPQKVCDDVLPNVLGYL